jgi:hypothetical protein
MRIPVNGDKYMTDVELNSLSGVAADRVDKFLSFIQTIMNIVFITSWILISFIIALSAIFIVVLVFIT